MASRKRSISSDSDLSALHKECDEASCPICMDHPHNAVLLICSSYNKGCRPYTCDTSYRHSNCFDRFKKSKEEIADTTTTNMELRDRTDDHYTWTNIENFEEGSNLRCPLCRGAVFGWKIIKEARNYLDLKSRSCSRESCSFIGNYRELRTHARRVHPTVHPGDIDPSKQRAWDRLEGQRAYDDVISAVHSAMPGSVVLGDYAIESGDLPLPSHDGGGRRWLSTLFLFRMMRDRRGDGGGSRVLSRGRYLWGENLLGIRNHEDDEEADVDVDEQDLNVPSDLGDGVRSSPSRRRRRLTRATSEEENRQF